MKQETKKDKKKDISNKKIKDIQIVVDPMFDDQGFINDPNKLFDDEQFFNRQRMNEDHPLKPPHHHLVHVIGKVLLGLIMIMLSLLGIKAYRTENVKTISWFKCLTIAFNIILSLH